MKGFWVGGGARLLIAHRFCRKNALGEKPHTFAHATSTMAVSTSRKDRVSPLLLLPRDVLSQVCRETRERQGAMSSGAPPPRRSAVTAETRTARPRP